MPLYIEKKVEIWSEVTIPDQFFQFFQNVVLDLYFEIVVQDPFFAFFQIVVLDLSLQISEIVIPNHFFANFSNYHPGSVFFANFENCVSKFPFLQFF